ncbi:hypothetical protein KO481_06535 [Nocardia sp. NEAU-G5]|uniref:carbonic anhydrase n=1 Tax=Nocardia albiluteola TaxID=2842303 RepID=A0ABS6ATF1_9NOCA|nr:carbonic anhydrase [Nocardia albiluteola]MBU3061178.1 hypothetical protein [Nocardia albiluteola]
MNNFDELLENNKRFAATDFSDRLPEIPFVPNKQVYILTCIDPRVDPADVLGLRLGDAIVARTVGGRVNQSFLDDLAWISYLHETVTPDADWFDLAVIHHTDCGSALMADDKLRHGFLPRGFDDAALRATAVTDPATTVPVDVAKILNSPTASGRIRVSGYSYNTATGHLTLVTPPTSRDR